MATYPPDSSGSCHTRVLEWVNPLKCVSKTLLTFEAHCLEEEITFGDLFEDSGVEVHRGGVF